MSSRSRTKCGRKLRWPRAKTSQASGERNSTFNLEKMTQESCNSSVTSNSNWRLTMRHIHSSITPRVIHQQARQALQRCLPWKDYHRSVTVEALLNLLLLMAATTAALSAVVKRFFGFSHETARQ